MKKIYLIFITLFLAWACNPLEDEVSTVEEAAKVPSLDFEYTLTEDDYDVADDACSCAGFGNFSSDDDVRTYIPVVLSEAFPAVGGGSSAIVHYDFFNGSSPDIRGTQQSFTVTAAEYDALGFGFGNFSDLAEDVPVYADFKVGAGSDGDYLDVTHEFFDGSVSTVTTRVVWVVANNAWVWAEPLPDDSYADFFNESPPDFSFEDEGEDNIPFWLKATKIFAVDGDQALIQWNWDNGPGTSQSVALYTFTNGEWIEYGDFGQITQETLNFGHNGTVWEPDNTIKYTLTGSDYAAISAAYAGSNPQGSDSMDNFGNYDIGLWSGAEIFESITTRLLEVFPGTAAGQKYLVSYAVWKPGADVFTINVIYDGSAWSEITN